MIAAAQLDFLNLNNVTLMFRENKQQQQQQYSTVHSTVVGAGCIPPSPPPSPSPGWRLEKRERGGGGENVHLKTHAPLGGDRG